MVDVDQTWSCSNISRVLLQESIETLLGSGMVGIFGEVDVTLCEDLRPGFLPPQVLRGF